MMIKEAVCEIQKTLKLVLREKFGIEKNTEDISVIETRKEFKGDKTVVIFPFVKSSGQNPEALASILGEELVKRLDFVESFEFVKGFLNVCFSSNFWWNCFVQMHGRDRWGFGEAGSKPKVMLEYSSPNTNKPLHLGHLRNNFLGWSVAKLLESVGHKVVKTQIINDRGIHICKSMLAYQLFGQAETPESSCIKGDHLVGKYYVLFDKHLQKEIADLTASGIPKEMAAKQAPILIKAYDMLRKWEQGDEETVSLWKRMNEWVYEGFRQTYSDIGVEFDEWYYESQTYGLGKEQVKEGIGKWCQQKSDGSVSIDLTADGLDEKILLRSDGTSVYMTQDIGTAMLRFKNHPDLNSMIYTVGDEQNYHFKVLFKVLEKMGMPWAANCFHLSYGMVDLPEGKMKSREGTVVDADDLLQQLVEAARLKTEELGKTTDLPEEEQKHLHKIIALAALKYFILKVEPKKRMVFNPNESVDLNGDTGPFIQYAYARIRSLERKADELGISQDLVPYQLNEDECHLIALLTAFPDLLQKAADELNPAEIAAYAFNLSKSFNKFYHDHSILSGSKDEQIIRMALCRISALNIKHSMNLLGIEVPEKM